MRPVNIRGGAMRLGCRCCQCWLTGRGNKPRLYIPTGNRIMKWNLVFYINFNQSINNELIKNIIMHLIQLNSVKSISTTIYPKKGMPKIGIWLISLKNKIILICFLYSMKKFAYYIFINLFLFKNNIISTEKLLTRELTSVIENIHALKIETFFSDCDGYL